MSDLGEHDPNSPFQVVVSVQGACKGGNGAYVSDLGEHNPNSSFQVVVSVQ